MRDSVLWAVRIVFAYLITTVASTPSLAQRAAPAVVATDEGAWHTLEVTGGAVALSSLGVDPSRERAAIMTELVRRLHFSANLPVELTARLLELRAGVAELETLHNAIAIASPAGHPPSLAMASDNKSRRKLEDVLESAGLELKNSRRVYRVEMRSGDTALLRRRRLAQVGIDAADLQSALNAGNAMSVQIPSTHLPLPLSPQLWSKVVFERPVSVRLLFTEILSDPSARLLFHGLAGMDAPTRRWIATQPDLIRRIYRDSDAVRSFSLFGPSIRIANGKVIVPGGTIGERRWSRVLDVSPGKPDQFVRRLFDHNAGRSAGLYFSVAAVDAPRRKFLLSAGEPGDIGDQRFARLVSSFENCYPRNATQYPFILRSHDAALMLLDVGITDDGSLAGPVWQRFWRRVFDGDSLPDDPVDALRNLREDGAVDAAWLVDALCGADATQRGAVFVTVLAANRLFAGVADAELPDVLVALRARRLYPAVFVALEHARVSAPNTHAAVARHAARLARLDNRERGVTALRQFQGALSLTLEAITAGTFAGAADTLLQSLAAVGFEDERYNGRLADWFVHRWLAAARPAGSSGSIEAIVAAALAGPVDPAPRRVRWEGQDYTLDFAHSELQRLLEVRKRQGGVTLDTAMELHRISSALRQSDMTVEAVRALGARLRRLAPQLRGMVRADEYADDGPRVENVIDGALKDLDRIDNPRELKQAAEIGGDLLPSVDFLFAHVLASWAYAPHVGDTDGDALIGGDASLHHLLGVAGTAGEKFQQRWELTVSAGTSRVVRGSLLGLRSALASNSLRRLSSDRVPPPPTIGGNDLTSFLLTASLSDPRRLHDTELKRVAAALSAGDDRVKHALADPERLAALGEMAAMSPWRREVLGWIATQEPARLEEQFSTTQRARLGGLSSAEARDWGSVSIVSGCFCQRIPPDRIPELIIGRAADGLLGGHSADLMLRVAAVLADLEMPAALAAPVLSYAMRDFLDHVQPTHMADFDAFSRQSAALNRQLVEDYLGAIAATGPLRPAGRQ